MNVQIYCWNIMWRRGGGGLELNELFPSKWIISLRTGDLWCIQPQLTGDKCQNWYKWSRLDVSPKPPPPPQMIFRGFGLRNTFQKTQPLPNKIRIWVYLDSGTNFKEGSNQVTNVIGLKFAINTLWRLLFPVNAHTHDTEALYWKINHMKSE